MAFKKVELKADKIVVDSIKTKLNINRRAQEKAVLTWLLIKFGVKIAIVTAIIAFL